VSRRGAQRGDADECVAMILPGTATILKLASMSIPPWLAVAQADRYSAASLELVAGSHLGPWLMPHSFMDAQAKWFPEGSLADLPDIDKHREAYRFLSWELEPGDAVCFHMLTLHGSRRATTC
jgi:ectoine hydroxylase-related dioxygenase (phytanoyl-CoA dioxygenase family)